MSLLPLVLVRVERQLTYFTKRHGLALLRVSVGLVFLWFGALKFLPGLSPAEDLAGRTIATLTFGLIPNSVALPVLAAWECAIGLGFLTGRLMRVAVPLMLAQMSGTILPLFFFPQETWLRFPFAATLEGQYIIKNVVLVSAALVLHAATHGLPLGASAAPELREVPVPGTAATRRRVPKLVAVDDRSVA